VPILRHLGTGDRIRLVVLAEADLPQLLEALPRLLPQATLIAVSSTRDDLQRTLTAVDRFDVVIDACPPDGQTVARFQAAFYHLRSGGHYVLLRGAGQLADPSPGSLGEHLSSARMVGDVKAAGGDLVVKARTSRALALLDEGTTDDYLTARPALGRVLDTVAPEPIREPMHTEGPVVREPRVDRPITLPTLRLREYNDVLVAPYQIVGTDRVLFSDTFRRGANSSHRAIARVAPGFGRLRDHWPDEPAELTGTYLHLDDEFRGHFGHLLTETAGRVWTWKKSLALDPEVRVLVGVTPQRPVISSFEAELYEAFGIPAERITLIDAPVRVQRLISGTSMYSVQDYVHPLIASTWDAVADHLAASAEPATGVDRPARIFASRRLAKRGCRNAAEVEEFFRRYGFTVVYPEEWPLAEQVAIFAAAEVVAGFGGSGLFQLALVKEPKRVIVLSHDSYHARNDYFMAIVRGHRVDAITSVADRPEFQSSFAFDFDREGEYLRSILHTL
jgi:capsular polysaccharide biosynthesis protein